MTHVQCVRPHIDNNVEVLHLPLLYWSRDSLIKCTEKTYWKDESAVCVYADDNNKRYMNFSFYRMLNRTWCISMNCQMSLFSINIIALFTNFRSKYFKSRIFANLERVKCFVQASVECPVNYLCEVWCGYALQQKLCFVSFGILCSIL